MADNPFKKFLTTKTLIFLVWIILLALGFFYVRSLGLSAQELSAVIENYVASIGLWGPVVYILLYTLRTLTFFSATVFTLLSGVLFGPILGAIYTIIAANLSATLAFFVGKFFGQEVIAKAGNNIKYFPSGTLLQENGLVGVLVMRLLFFPFDWVGYICGAYKLKFRDFAIGNFLGLLPGTIAFVALGGAIFDPENRLKALAIFLPFFLFGIVVSKILKKKTKLGRSFSAIKEGEGKDVDSLEK